MNIIFPLSVVDEIMKRGLFLCMNSCMYARMYVYLCICMLVCMHVCVYVWRMTLLMSKRKQNIHSFIPAISIAPLQVIYYSEALPTTARILYRSFTPKRTGNCR